MQIIHKPLIIIILLTLFLGHLSAERHKGGDLGTPSFAQEVANQGGEKMKRPERKISSSTREAMNSQKQEKRKFGKVPKIDGEELMQRLFKWRKLEAIRTVGYNLESALNITVCTRAVFVVTCPFALRMKPDSLAQVSSALSSS